MARHPLTGAWAKIDRARENLDALDAGTQAFRKRNPYAITVDERSEAGAYVVVVVLRAERPPARLSVIAGDVIHNLRSALDHLAWELVIAEGGKPGRHTQFPIYTDEGGYRRDVSERVGTRSPGPLAGVDPSGTAWALVQAEQPYHRPEPQYSALATIQAFSNIDKHRTLLLRGNILRRVDLKELVFWDPGAILLEQHVNIEGPVPLEHSTELATIRFDPSAADPDMHVYRELPVQVTFGDEERQIPLAVFDRMRVSVATLLDKFEQFF